MAEASRKSEKLNVFISYSRDDLAFSHQLAVALRVTGFNPVIDRDGISAGEAWQSRLGTLIRDADTVAFVLSPSSAGSKVCAWEVEEAAKLGKRIIPIVCRPLADASPPPRLTDLNYIFFYPEPKSPDSGFGSGLERLVGALDTDVDWLREHTRYLQRATEWDGGGRPENRLLSGADIATAKAWVARRPRDAPEPSELHLDYIRLSEVAEGSRKNAERQRLEQMAVAQSEREKALNRERDALRRAEAAVRIRQRMQKAVALLLIGIIAGLVGWIYQKQLNAQLNWFMVARPFMLSHVRPYVLKEEAERALKPRDTFRECATDCPEMIALPAGTFTMGSPNTEKDRRAHEGPQLKVTIGRQFAVSKFHVTFADWDRCVNVGGCPHVTDSGFGRGTKPIVNINWDEAKQYADWLSQMTGKRYRLLSEGEWEYAARAGTTTAYPWGDEIGIGNANCDGCGSRWDSRETSPVGSFNPNPFGLFDMHGNVFQWLEDCYEGSLDGVPPDASPRTSGSCSRRVIRGGSWRFGPEMVRSAHRLWDDAGGRGFYVVGLRVARDISP